MGTPQAAQVSILSGSAAFRREEQTRRPKTRLVEGLGWFSIGVGVAEVLAPRSLAKLIGIKKRPFLIRLFGVREIANGIGILLTGQPAGWMLARVAGDAIDLAYLSAAVATTKRRRVRRVLAAAGVAGVAALDVLCSRELIEEAAKTPVSVEKTVSVNRSPEQVYQFLRDFRNLPRFMKHVESVQPDGERRCHWAMKAPTGRRIEWDAEIVEDRPNELIAWRSVPGACMESSGSAQLKATPGGRGTYVTFKLQFSPPGGAIGRAVAKVFSSVPENRLKEDLRRLRQLIETGEVATTEGQPSGANRALGVSESDKRDYGARP